MSLVQHVLVAAFHHQNGPVVEWVYPPLPDQPQGDDAAATGATTTAVKLPEQWATLLPFCSLPDGAHMSEECFNAFHLPPVDAWDFAKATVFASSCYRQIDASELLVKTPDITRQKVQKAVVVLSSEPIFGAVKEKLGMVTAALFEQRDFTNKNILVNFYENLVPAFKKIPESSLYLGLSLRNLVTDFRTQTLTLFKLLLLEKRVLFYATNIDKLIATQYSLISLMPDLMLHLHVRIRTSSIGLPIHSHLPQDVGSPDIEADVPVSQAIDCASQSTRYTDPGSGSSVSKSTLFDKASLPLKVFGKGSFFQPYLPLQQVDLLTSPEVKFFMVGTTNGVFKDNLALRIDAIVDVDSKTVEFPGGSLNSALSLSAPDKKWIQELVTQVCPPPDAPGSAVTLDVGYNAGDDHIRSMFEHYVITLLATTAFGNEPAQQEAQKDPSDPASPENKKHLVGEFNQQFVAAWSSTRNYTRWMDTVSSDLPEVVEPSHPCHGHTAVQEYQARLQSKIQEMNLDEKKEKLQQTLNAAAATVGTYVDKVKAEASRRVAEHQAAQQSRSQTPSPQKDKTPGGSTSIDTEKLKQEAKQAANKARVLSASLWSSASNYIATKRAEVQAHQNARNADTPKTTGAGEKGLADQADPNDDDDGPEQGPGGGQYAKVSADDATSSL
ncbi:hypothetical protein RI367_000450 [Sorochytrium milnesiophthora]